MAKNWLQTDDGSLHNLDQVTHIVFDGTSVTYYYADATTAAFTPATAAAVTAFAEVKAALAKLDALVDLTIEITTITPAPTGPAAGSTPIMVIGQNLTPGFALTIGGAACTSLTFIDSTRLQAVTPAGTAGAQDVVYTDSIGRVSTMVGGFLYV